MAKVQCTAILAIFLVFQSNIVNANFNVPVLSSPLISGDVCRENACGRGDCVPSSSSTFGFECECEPGWRQARPDNNEFLKFLPCVIPNCTLNYSCGDAPPAPNNENRAHLSPLDPCFWTNCGGGACKTTSVFTHTCECEEGYYNLFNATAFPCYRQCSIGVDCPKLGLDFANTSSSTQGSNPSLDDRGNSQVSSAASLPHGAERAFLITIATTLARVLWCFMNKQ